jgi:hypothetical protein
MPEPQVNNVADAEGIAKIVLMLFGAGGFLKVTVALINKVWDRYIKQDEYRHTSQDKFDAIILEELKSERQLSDTLRKEYSTVREQLYSANTAHALSGLEVDRLREENTELRTENERYRKILEKFNHPTD